MTKIERVMRELNDLWDFERRLRKARKGSQVGRPTYGSGQTRDRHPVDETRRSHGDEFSHPAD